MNKQQARKARSKTEAQASDPVSIQKLGLWPSVGAKRHLAVVFGLGLLVLLTFANTFRNTGFALDNKFIILEDPRLREANQANLGLIVHEDYWWPKAVSGLYRPLTTLSYLLNYAILGNTTHAAGYHWLNFLVHWLNAALVYFMALVLMKKLWPAMFIAALFATHPIVTESVTNIVGRSDLFATAAILGGFLCYAKSATRTGIRKLPWLLALMVITTLGVFFKESAVMVLGVMALYDFTFRLRPLHRNRLVNCLVNFWQFSIRGYVAVLPPLVAVAWVRASVFQHMRPPEFPFVDNPMVSVALERGGHYFNSPIHNSLHNWLVCTLTGIKVLGQYLLLLAWPQTLCCDYSYNQVPLVDLGFRSFEDWKAILGLVMVLVVVAFGVRQYRRNPVVFFCILFFFLTLLPTSNLIIVTGSIMAERFLYLPSIGFAGCVAMAAYAVGRKFVSSPESVGPPTPDRSQLVSACILSVIVAAWGVRAFVRNFDWNDDVALWTAAVKVCPNSFKTHKSLAYAFYERDMAKSPPEFPDIDRIVAEGEKAVAVMEKTPVPAIYNTSIVYLHLGVYYRIKGDTVAHQLRDAGPSSQPPAVSWFQRSVQTLSAGVPPDRAFNEANRKKELERGRQPDEICDVGNAEIFGNLGMSYERLGQYQDALNCYFYMRHLSPMDGNSYLNIASMCLALNRPGDAVVALLQCMIIDHSRQDARQALVALYRRTGVQDCALATVPGQTQVSINLDCPLVQEQLCVAYRGIVQVFLGAKEPGLAEQFKQVALKNYRCTPNLFEKLQPDSTTAPNSTHE